ncbi:hypothetical protein OB919_15830 [Halobacteria archaeon AArc-curdl1]|uniref:Uncharacterized protein n=1 Tax=Natronosalvus hydrolyticus TaxID=2979988 RepID=A0AAP2Z9Z8_9EURY|nr:hypothetical protein [Halobacteria archaeon AArc-curdl1]
MARVAQNLETPLDERIEYATWPETLLYLSTMTMDARYANKQVKDLYQHTFREYLDHWTPLEPDDQPPPLCEDPELSSYDQERLEDLRFGIKKDRDRHFVQEMYDDLGVEGVPKTFWLTRHELENLDADQDEYSQSALDEYF